jgi:subtilisin
MESGESPTREACSRRTETRSGSDIGRRSCLKLLGGVAASAAGIAAGTDVVRAASDDHGELGFGEIPYGGGDGGLSVSTLGATSVTATSARFAGELSDLGGASAADCYFAWRAVGVSSWNTTGTRTLSTTGTFVVEVGGLSTGTEYEYRAVAAGSGGDTVSGNAVTFTTDAGSTAPTVDRYSVTEAGSPNPHCEITAEWRVSDPDGDLDTVTVAVLDPSGAVVAEETTAATGGRDSGTDAFSIKHAKGRTFYVRVTVTDAVGHSDSGIRSVTE